MGAIRELVAEAFIPRGYDERVLQWQQQVKTHERAGEQKGTLLATQQEITQRLRQHIPEVDPSVSRQIETEAETYRALALTLHNTDYAGAQAKFNRYSGWMWYETRLSKGMHSSPEQFIRLYSSEKPSVLTRSNFTILTGHMLGVPDPKLSIVVFRNELADVTSSVHGIVDSLKKERGDLEQALDQEYEICSTIRAKTLMVSDAYLNSLDIPSHIKALYPSAEPERARPLSSRLEDWYDRVSGLDALMRMDKEPTTCELISILLKLSPYTLKAVARQGGKLRNKLWKDHHDWTPSLEEFGQQEAERFWTYFKYHPERDVPVDFDQDSFNPIPQVNPHYFPRITFKQKVYEFYDAARQAIVHYRTHEVPADHSGIMQARSFVVRHIQGIEAMLKDSGGAP